MFLIVDCGFDDIIDIDIMDNDTENKTQDARLNKFDARGGKEAQVVGQSNKHQDVNIANHQGARIGTVASSQKGIHK